MQPEFSPVQRPAEQIPQANLSYEGMPQFPSPEVQPTHYERRELPRVEQAPTPPPTTPIPVQVVIPDPTTGMVVRDDTAVNNPVSANDDDTIEKEWVDRTKQIIEQTKNDPFNRERALGELQRDYLMKRYGKQVGRSE